ETATPDRLARSRGDEFQPVRDTDRFQFQLLSDHFRGAGDRGRNEGFGAFRDSSVPSVVIVCHHRGTQRYTENQFLLTAFFRLALLRSSCAAGITSTFENCFCKSGRNFFASPTIITFVLSAFRREVAKLLTSAGFIDCTLETYRLISSSSTPYSASEAHWLP